MPRDLVKRVRRAAAAREFEQLLLGGYADELRGPAAVCAADSSAATASVGSKRNRTAATTIAILNHGSVTHGLGLYKTGVGLYHFRMRHF
jgi:hypothetical protein